MTDFSVPLEGPDGRLEERVFDTDWSPVRDETGAVAGALQTLFEATDRCKAQAAMRESEARHRLLIGSWAQAVRETDAAGVVVDSPSWRAYTGQTLEEWTYLTPAFETIYGLGRQSALHGDNMTGWLDLIVPEDRRAALDAIQNVRGGERAAFEYRVRRPSDGQVRWVRDTDFPMRDAAGQVRQIGGVGRDITEEKASVQRQEVLVNELQHRARNLLGVVTAVAGRTLRQGCSVRVAATASRSERWCGLNWQSTRTGHLNAP